jgi:hypothetical protein
MKILLSFIGAVLVLVWIVNAFGNGWHRETSHGDHVGYITAVEKTGIWWKTGRAYLKTDTQSSQEDAYCVIDEGVYKQLKNFSAQKAHIKVEFADYMIRGWKLCGDAGEVAVIISVAPTSN